MRAFGRFSIFAVESANIGNSGDGPRSGLGEQFKISIEREEAHLQGKEVKVLLHTERIRSRDGKQRRSRPDEKLRNMAASGKQDESSLSYLWISPKLGVPIKAKRSFPKAIDSATVRSRKKGRQACVIEKRSACSAPACAWLSQFMNGLSRRRAGTGRNNNWGG